MTRVHHPSAYSGLTERDAQTLIDRAVSPEIAALRGYRSITATDARKAGFSPSQARSGIEIPRHNTQGIIDDLPQLRPHEPRINDEGKPVKYELPAGARHVLDVTPRSQPHLTNLDLPILMTESMIKADAIESAIPPDTYCVLSINGVWGWISNGTPITDFRDARFCEKKHDRVTRRRDAVFLLDSDTATNPHVATARYQLAQYIERRGARPLFVDVPPAPDGSKQGIDDALANGHVLADLLATAYAPKEPTATDFPDDPDRQRIAELEATVADITAELAEVKEQNHLLVATLCNPNIDGLGTAAVRTVMYVAHERRMGRAREDGSVKATARKIGDDNRPFDDHAPILPASTAYANHKRLDKLGLIDRRVEPAPVSIPKQTKGADNRWHPVRNEAGTIEYVDTVTDVTFLNLPGETINDMLRPFAFFAPPTDTAEAAETPVTSKRGGDRRSAAFRRLKAAMESPPPCPHCGDDALTLVCTACACTVSVTDLAQSAEVDEPPFKLETGVTKDESQPPFQIGTLKSDMGQTAGSITGEPPFEFETGVNDVEPESAPLPPKTPPFKLETGVTAPASLNTPPVRSAPVLPPVVPVSTWSRGRGHLPDSCRNPEYLAQIRASEQAAR